MCHCYCAKSLQSCPTLCDPMDCSPSGSSVLGILQARIVEWVAIPSSRGSSWPWDQTRISYVSWEAPVYAIKNITFCMTFWVLYCLKRSIWIEDLRYTKAKRWEDNYQPNSRLLLTVSKRKKHARPHGRSMPGPVKKQRERGVCGQMSLLWFQWEGMGKTGWAVLGLATLNDFSSAWSIGASPSCLVPGPGHSGQVDSRPVHEILIEEVAGVWALNWLMCIWKVHAQVSCWLSMGSSWQGQSLQHQQCPRCQGIRIQKVKNMWVCLFSFL